MTLKMSLGITDLEGELRREEAGFGWNSDGGCKYGSGCHDR